MTEQSLWARLSARRGRNDLPDILFHACQDGTLYESGDIAEAVEDAWTSAEWPEQQWDAASWAFMFESAAEWHEEYLHDAEVRDRSELPEQITLYRGAIEGRKRGMSWTDNRELAHWFAHRFDGMRGRDGSRQTGTVWTVTVDRDMILARFESGRGESEWVLNPADLEDLDVREYEEEAA